MYNHTCRFNDKLVEDKFGKNKTKKIHTCSKTNLFHKTQQCSIKIYYRILSVRKDHNIIIISKTA